MQPKPCLHQEKFKKIKKKKKKEKACYSRHKRIQEHLRFKKSHVRSMAAAQAPANLKPPLQNGNGGYLATPPPLLLTTLVQTHVLISACLSVTNFGSFPCSFRDRLLRPWSQLFCHGTALASLCQDLISSYSWSHFFLLLRNPALSPSHGWLWRVGTGVSCRKKRSGSNKKDELPMWESLRWVTMDGGSRSNSFQEQWLASWACPPSDDWGGLSHPLKPWFSFDFDDLAQQEVTMENGCLSPYLEDVSGQGRCTTLQTPSIPLGLWSSSRRSQRYTNYT